MPAPPPSSSPPLITSPKARPRCTHPSTPSLPLCLYNRPPLTKVAITVDTVRRVMDNPKIVGLKDSSCDLMYFQKVIALQPQRPGFRFYTGPEELLSESVLMGGHGGVSGGAN